MQHFGTAPLPLFFLRLRLGRESQLGRRMSAVPRRRRACSKMKPSVMPFHQHQPNAIQPYWNLPALLILVACCTCKVSPMPQASSPLCLYAHALRAPSLSSTRGEPRNPWLASLRPLCMLDPSSGIFGRLWVCILFSFSLSLLVLCAPIALFVQQQPPLTRFILVPSSFSCPLR